MSAYCARMRNFTPIATSLLVLAAGWSSSSATPLAGITQQFQDDFSIRNLFISNPFEADPTSNYNATMSVIVQDQDYPSEQAIHCQIEWKAGVGPPASTKHQCENDTMRAWFPEGTFKGVQDFQLQFAHTVLDTDIGPCPQYCYLTKFAAVNLTYTSTPNYDCDPEGATCEQRVNTTLTAPVYLAVG